MRSTRRDCGLSVIVRVGFLLIAFCALGCRRDNVQPAGDDAAVVRRFCGDCHTFPQPDTYPLHEWPEKVREGFNFYHASLRSDLEVPSIEAVERFYAARAPERLEIVATHRPLDDTDESMFAPAEAFVPDAPLRAVAQLQATKDSSSGFNLLLCDMRSGRMLSFDEDAEFHRQTEIGRCLNPCHIEATDLNADGQTDYVVCDLGSFMPEDHSMGAVWYVHSDHGEWQMAPLADGLGRVTDAQPVDIDHDGDLDLIVAEFGWRTTGSILLLRNQPDEHGFPQMRPETIDHRHGTIHVPVVDLNADGHPDFIALISQEFESIEAFINVGGSVFERHVVFASDNPGFGSSGIELVDMDSDGDLDVLYVNGDSLDTPIAKPYHGVRWLENAGVFPYPVHEACHFPGAHCVRGADLDADGDTDIVAVALLPGAAVADYAPGTFDSVIWLEQQADGSFVGRSLERDNCSHAACELADWDGDGDLDLIVADMSPDPTAEHSLTIFKNRTAVTPGQ